MREESDRSAAVAAEGQRHNDAASEPWFARDKRGAGRAAVGVVVTGAVVTGAVVTGVAAVSVSASPASVETVALEAPPNDLGSPTEPAFLALTFAPIVTSGSGDATVPIEIPGVPAESGEAEPASGRVLVAITHDGSSNVAVWALGPDLERGELLVNTIGGYEGTRTMPVATAGLAIEADGAWTATVLPASAAESFTGAAQASGDAVAVYAGEPGVLAVQHDGAGVFTVVAYRTDGTSELLVNQVGEFEGEIEVSPGSLLAVTADGEWSISAG